MSVRDTTVSGTVSSATEFWYFLCARYNVYTLNLRIHCDGCGTTFMVSHVFICSTGVLVILCHNKIYDELLYLYRRAFTPASVRAGPLIHQGRTRSDKETRQGSDKEKEIRGDMMIQGLWY